MALYIVNKSPFYSSDFQALLEQVGEHDQIILIDDGVYALKMLEELPVNTLSPVAVLIDSANLRGVTVPSDIKNIQAADYKMFVELCTQHHPVVSW